VLTQHANYVTIYVLKKWTLICTYLSSCISSSKSASVMSRLTSWSATACGNMAPYVLWAGLHLWFLFYENKNGFDFIFPNVEEICNYKTDILIRTCVLSDNWWKSFLCDFAYLYRNVVHTNIKMFILFLYIFIFFSHKK